MKRKKTHERLAFRIGLAAKVVKMNPKLVSDETAFKAALLLGKRAIYEKMVAEALQAHKRLKIPATREGVIKSFEKQIPNLREILGETH